MSVAIPYWPGRRLVIGAYTLKLGKWGLAIHSNITPGKLADESAHILMVDLDEKLEEKYVRFKCELHCLYGAFYYRTPHGWHIIHNERYSWKEMRRLQMELNDDDLHTRATARYGRAALFLHPPKQFHQYQFSDYRVGPWSNDTTSIPHYFFYMNWHTTGGDIEHAKKMLKRGQIAFRICRRNERAA